MRPTYGLGTRRQEPGNPAFPGIPATVQNRRYLVNRNNVWVFIYPDDLESTARNGPVMTGYSRSMSAISRSRREHLQVQRFSGVSIAMLRSRG